jgi:hypothetical protein
MSYADPQDHGHAPTPWQDTMCPGPFNIWWALGCAYVCVKCGAVTATDQTIEADPPPPVRVGDLDRATDGLILEIAGWRGSIFKADD